MPKTNKDGSAKKSELPDTLKRSPAKAQRTYAHAYDSAIDQYDGDEERAHRVAFAALKHSFEKVGDHWEAKDEPGPSDAHAEKGGPNVAEKTAGGVNANATKEHLLGIARRLDIRGRSTMTKDELVTAIQKANDQANAQARTS